MSSQLNSADGYLLLVSQWAPLSASSVSKIVSINAFEGMFRVTQGWERMNLESRDHLSGLQHMGWISGHPTSNFHCKMGGQVPRTKCTLIMWPLHLPSMKGQGCTPSISRKLAC